VSTIDDLTLFLSPLPHNPTDEPSFLFGVLIANKEPPEFAVVIAVMVCF
jgi:hypothetical protein